MPVFSETVHCKIYIGGLILLALSLPFSVFGMSVSQLIILGNFILEGDFKNRFNSIRKRYDLWIFVSIYIIHLFWLFPPQDYNYAFNDLKIKIPLMVFPLIVSMSRPLHGKTIRNILLCFVFSIMVASLISIGLLLKNQSSNVINYRELSVFISHIRFSLMVVLSIFILFYYSFVCTDLKLKRWYKIVAVLIMVCLIFFLFILKAQTGLFVFAIVSYLLLWYFSFKLKLWYKYIIMLLLIIFPVFPVVYVYLISRKFIDIEKIDYNTVEKKTLLGNDYTFNPEDKSIENGYLVWAYYCEKELQKEWAKQSDILYLGKDNNNNDLRFTLVRYMTSKGLRKDSLGFSQMTPDDIKAVENGIPNYTFINNWKLYPLIYNIIWELYDYKSNKYADGHSIAQRIEYLKTAMEIIQDNLLLGVGTGNVKLAFDNEYYRMNSGLDNKWRLRAHNQFVTFLLTFGIFGFTWIIFALFYPVIKQKGYKSFLFTIFFSIAILSFTNEDTLETQAGLTFFVFFYTIFLFSKEKQIVQMEQ